MTDTAGVTGGCNALCGCPVPCPGGNSCGCRAADTTPKMEGGADHNKCSCGEHCGCNPCSCQKGSGGGVMMMRVGKAHCKCGSGCTCTACAA